MLRVLLLLTFSWAAESGTPAKYLNVEKVFPLGGVVSKPFPSNTDMTTLHFVIFGKTNLDFEKSPNQDFENYDKIERLGCKVGDFFWTYQSINPKEKRTLSLISMLPNLSKQIPLPAESRNDVALNPLNFDCERPTPATVRFQLDFSSQQIVKSYFNAPVEIDWGDGSAIEKLVAVEKSRAVIVKNGQFVPDPNPNLPPSPAYFSHKYTKTGLAHMQLKIMRDKQAPIVFHTWTNFTGPDPRVSAAISLLEVFKNKLKTGDVEGALKHFHDEGGTVAQRRPVLLEWKKAGKLKEFAEKIVFVGTSTVDDRFIGMQTSVGEITFIKYPNGEWKLTF